MLLPVEPGMLRALLLMLLIPIGLLAFVVRLTQDAHSAWVSYVTNWMFFSSIAMGSVMFAASPTCA